MRCLSRKHRGTCDRGDCPMHGICHCGCGTVMPIARKQHTRDQRTLGMPGIFRAGHSPTARQAARLHGLKTGDPRRFKGPTSPVHLHDLPLSKVQPLARFLVDHYGDATEAARRTGVAPVSMRGWVAGRVKAVSRESAEKLVVAVLAVRNRKHPDLPHTPRAALSLESGLTRDPRTERDRLYQRKYRASREWQTIDKETA